MIHQQPPRSAAIRKRNSLRLLCWGWLPLALGWFLARGPGQVLPATIEAGGDLAAPYAGARAWAQGQNPYDDAVLADILRGAGRQSDGKGNPHFTIALYPPTAFPPL